jgi:cytochrome d ubiquinol oxidase subunit I
MRTAHSVTPSLTGFDVLLSLLGYMAVYLIMFPTGLWFIARIVRGGVTSEEVTPVEAGRPSAPVKPVPGAAP